MLKKKFSLINQNIRTNLILIFPFASGAKVVSRRRLLATDGHTGLPTEESLYEVANRALPAVRFEVRLLGPRAADEGGGQQAQQQQQQQQAELFDGHSSVSVSLTKKRR